LINFSTKDIKNPFILKTIFKGRNGR